MNSTDTIALCALAMSGLATFVALRSVGYTKRQALAAEAMVPPPPPPVKWRMRQRDKDTYVLRNIGPETATGVQIIVPAVHGELVTYDLGDGRVPSESAVEVRIISLAEYGKLTEIEMTWDGQAGTVRVPIPD